MSTLETSAKYLSEKGLSVEIVSSERLFINREGDRMLDITKTEGGFNVRSWEYAPGPGEEDFSFIVPSLDETLLIAWCYYFAKNISIAGWELPLHRRPYWNLPKLQYRLANAPHITASQLEILRHNHLQRALAHPSKKSIGVTIAEHTQFIAAGRHANSGNLLFVRRDMEEAYIVTNATPSSEPTTFGDR